MRLTSGFYFIAWSVYVGSILLSGFMFDKVSPFIEHHLCTRRFFKIDEKTFFGLALSFPFSCESWRKRKFGSFWDLQPVVFVPNIRSFSGGKT